MWSLLERAKKVIFALVLSIIPLILLYVQSKDQEMRDVFSWPITEATGMIEKGTLMISGGISDLLYRYLFLVGRTDELIKLRAQVLETKALKSRVAELLNERQSIADLYFRTSSAGLPKGELARVVARAGAPMSRMVRLDRGSVHGIQAKSPVLAHEGVVGQVLSVAPHFCDVLLITDASSAIDAKIVGSDARGLLRGITNSSEYLMEIRDIDGLVEVAAGNIVVTSGVNSNFPHGVPIGTVIESFRSRDGLYVSARIEPFVPMDRLSYVLVLNDVKNDPTMLQTNTAAWPLAVQ